MPDQRDQQKQQGGQRGQQQSGVVEISGHQARQPSQKPEQGGQQQHGSGHMSTDQISFYDESLKKEVQGSFKSDGKSIHIFSEYGNKSASYVDLGPCTDYNAQVLLAKKLLSELARDPGSGKFKDLQQPRDYEEPHSESFSGWGVGSVG